MEDINKEIEDFLKKRPNTIYSLRTISRNVGIKKRKVLYYVNNNKDIIKCDSYDVGSSKRGLQLYKML